MKENTKNIPIGKKRNDVIQNLQGQEIKIRAWHFTQNRMIGPEELEIDQLTLLTTGNFINVHGADQKLSRIFNRDEMLPMQYIGETDCNNIDIFYGDIYMDGQDMKYKIVDEKTVAQWKYTVSQGGTFKSTIRIDGNIFEDYELLGQHT